MPTSSSGSEACGVRPSLAVFSPVPPAHTGVADYVASLSKALASDYAIDLYAEGLPAQSYRLQGLAYRTPGEFAARRAQYSDTIYHVGNNPLHAYLYPTLVSHPGTVVLHDWSLHGMLHAALSPGEYLTAMAEAYENRGEAAAQRILRDGLDGGSAGAFPLNERILAAASALLVHSDWMVREIGKVLPNKPVRKVRMGTELQPPNAGRRATVLESLGIDSSVTILGAFGYVTAHKRLDVVLRVFRELCHKVSPQSLHLLVIGEGPALPGLRGLAHELGVAGQVHFLGAVSDDTFANCLAATDIAVNLRYPSYGETSASLFRLLGAGLPVLVTSVGSFIELPDSVCWKVDPDMWEEPLLLTYLTELVERPELRRAMAEEALAIAAQHTWQRVAEDYRTALADLRGVGRGS